MKLITQLPYYTAVPWYYGLVREDTATLTRTVAVIPLNLLLRLAWMGWLFLRQPFRHYKPPKDALAVAFNRGYTEGRLVSKRSSSLERTVALTRLMDDAAKDMRWLSTLATHEQTDTETPKRERVE